VRCAGRLFDGRDDTTKTPRLLVLFGFTVAMLGQLRSYSQITAVRVSSIVAEHVPHSANGRRAATSPTVHRPSDSGTATITLPTILLAGAQKAGTTALAQWLLAPPFNKGVCGPVVFEGEPAHFKKEVQFFDQEERYERGTAFYERRFGHCHFSTTRNDHGVVLSMDATPNYIRFPQRVFDTYERAGQLGSLKIIFSLREPVARDLSWYNHRKGYANVYTYDQHVRKKMLPGLKDERSGDRFAVDMCLYAKHLEAWFRLFRREQILVLSYDEVLHNSTKARGRVEAFLGHRFPAEKLEKENTKDGASKLARPACDTQRELDTLFRPHNERLYALLAEGGRPYMEQHPFPKFSLGSCTEPPEPLLSGGPAYIFGGATRDIFGGNSLVAP